MKHSLPQAVLLASQKNMVVRVCKKQQSPPSVRESAYGADMMNYSELAVSQEGWSTFWKKGPDKKQHRKLELHRKQKKKRVRRVTS